MTSSPPVKSAPRKDGKSGTITYGFDPESEKYFYQIEGQGEKTCSSSELLEVSEAYQLPEEDRGAILLEFPLSE